MSLAVAIQMDPIEDVDIDADSTFALALEAQRRGHALWHYLPRDLALLDGRVVARARPLSVRREKGDHEYMNRKESNGELYQVFREQHGTEIVRVASKGGSG